MSSPKAGDACGLNRFQSLWRRCLLDNASDHSAEIHQRLTSAYNEPQRHYHTLDHIGHCLSLFDQCKALLDNPDALELAIWFHDAIFETGKPDNELRSAELYQSLSADVHPNELRELVGRLIIATLHDGGSLEDKDAGYMVDIDLSSFGLPWEDFLRDTQDLRKECGHLSDEEYYQRQSSFRTGLMARPKFYMTDYFYERYEQQARENLERYFARAEDTNP